MFVMTTMLLMIAIAGVMALIQIMVILIIAIYRFGVKDLILGLISIFAYLLERRVSLCPAMIWAQVLSSISLVRKDLRYMPNIPWVPWEQGPWLP